MRIKLLVTFLVIVGLVIPAIGDHDANAATTPIGASPVELVLDPVADGFATPLWGTNAPGLPDQLFVVDQIGVVTSLRVGSGNAPERMIFLDVGPSGLDLIQPLTFAPRFNERGLLGLAFHPDYAANGLLYTMGIEPLGPVPDFSTVASGGDSLSVLREWRVNEPGDPASVVDPTSTRVLMRVLQPQGNHNGGAVAFGPDELLYIALGDGGGRDDEGAGHAPEGNGQDLSDGNPLGKILRIDPLARTSANGQYGVPPDNPFVGRPGIDEAWAYGFRNPFRISFDPLTGTLYAGDVGQGDREEVNIVVPGGNYGWPVKEGTHLFERNGTERGEIGPDSPGLPTDMIDPVANYDHGEGISVTGGFVSRGSRLPDLAGSYVFGDLAQRFSDPSGRLFELTAAGELRELLPENRSDVPLYITGFGQDAAGDVYVMGVQRVETAGSSGRVLRLEEAGAPSEPMCRGQRVTIDMNTNGGDGIGTQGADVIAGTPGDDVINGGGGDDVVCGFGGDDKIFGGPGADILDGGDGADTIHGNRGDDSAFGGAGNDRIFGYADDDTIDGGDGDDRLHGNFGDDIVDGGTGDDAMFGYGDDDILTGGEGRDLIGGNFGDDVIRGDSENDVLYGSDGADIVSGGAGDDSVAGNSGNDIIDGNSGNDTLDGGIGTDVCAGKAGFDTATRCETTTGVP